MYRQWVERLSSAGPPRLASALNPPDKGGKGCVDVALETNKRMVGILKEYGVELLEPPSN